MKKSISTIQGFPRNLIIIAKVLIIIAKELINIQKGRLQECIKIRVYMRIQNVNTNTLHTKTLQN